MWNNCNFVAILYLNTQLVEKAAPSTIVINPQLWAAEVISDCIGMGYASPSVILFNPLMSTMTRPLRSGGFCSVGAFFITFQSMKEYIFWISKKVVCVLEVVCKPEGIFWRLGNTIWVSNSVNDSVDVRSKFRNTVWVVDNVDDSVDVDSKFEDIAWTLRNVDCSEWNIEGEILFLSFFPFFWSLF